MHHALGAGRPTRRTHSTRRDVDSCSVLLRGSSRNAQPSRTERMRRSRPVTARRAVVRAARGNHRLPCGRIDERAGSTPKCRATTGSGVVGQQLSENASACIRPGPVLDYKAEGPEGSSSLLSARTSSGVPPARSVPFCRWACMGWPDVRFPSYRCSLRMTAMGQGYRTPRRAGRDVEVRAELNLRDIRRAVGNARVCHPWTP